MGISNGEKIKISIVNNFGIIYYNSICASKRENPTFEKSNEIVTPPVVKDILKTSCYDCHSNETVFPIYAYIAPVSWLVTHDVEEGRKELNFSEWNTYSEKRKLKKGSEIKEEIEENKMPMPIYTFIHGEANLTEEEKTILFDWVETTFVKLPED